MSRSTLSEEQLNGLKETVLLEKIAYLCEELGDPGRYFPELRSKNVLNMTDTQLIKTKPTDRDKTEEFVTLISKRRGNNGQHGLDVFVDALKKQRVHAHVARTLLRAFNKKKAEAERTSTPIVSPGYHSLARDSSPSSSSNTDSIRHQQTNSYVNTPTSDISNNGSSSSQHEIHPDYGVLPPSQPPPLSKDTSQLCQAQGDTHPKYGLRPNPPPASSNSASLISPQQEMMAASHLPPPAPNGHHNAAYVDTTGPPSFTDELGAQSMAYTDTSLSTMSTNDTSLSTSDLETGKMLTSRSSSAPSTTSMSGYPQLATVEGLSMELERVRKELERVKLEKQRQDNDYKAMVQSLQIENMRLKEQLYHHRPSNLHIVPPHIPSSYHYMGGAGVDYSLTPPMGMAGRQRHPSPSPGPVGERESPVLRSAISSGSLNSHSSKGSYNPSESQV